MHVVPFDACEHDDQSQLLGQRLDRGPQMLGTLTRANKISDRLAFGAGIVAPVLVPGMQFGGEDGTVYSLTYANTVEDGSPNSATLSIHSSIIRAPAHDAGAGNAVVANRIDGDSPNPSTVNYWFSNFAAGSAALGNATTGGTGTANPADPLLLALTRFSDPDAALPVFPFRPQSPAFNAAATCRLVDAAGNLISGAGGKLVNDARSVIRSYAACDVGSYEDDNDEIFPDDLEGGL